MEEVTSIEHLEPKITERRVWNLNHLFLGFFIAVVLVGIALFLIINYNLDLTNSLIVVLTIVIIFSGVLFFLIEPKVLREVESTIVHRIEKPIIVEKPVIQEVPVEKKVFVDRPVEVIKEIKVPVEVIKEVRVPVEVEREVIKEVKVPVEVEKKVFIEKPVEKTIQISPTYSDDDTIFFSHQEPEEKPTTNKYSFVASEQTRVYHTKNCRLGKLIKRKYKFVSDNEQDFIKEGFQPCKVCIQKTNSTK